MEKVLESIMRTHSAWIKMEEYELTLSDEQIKAVFDVITRVEELLNVTPLEEYHTLCMQLVGTLTPHKSQAQSLLASEGTAATRTWQHTITRQAQQRLLFMPLVAMA